MNGNGTQSSPYTTISEALSSLNGATQITGALGASCAELNFFTDATEACVD
jgi:hypothetical protein